MAKGIVEGLMETDYYKGILSSGDSTSKAIYPAPVAHQDSDKITFDHPESVEPEETDDRLRVGDEFELNGQNYRVHRIAKKNIVIRKMRTVALPGKAPDMVIIDEATPCPEMEALYKDLSGVDE
jgi:hypothetical protein